MSGTSTSAFSGAPVGRYSTLRGASRESRTRLFAVVYASCSLRSFLLFFSRRRSTFSGSGTRYVGGVIGGRTFYGSAPGCWSHFDGRSSTVHGSGATFSSGSGKCYGPSRRGRGSGGWCSTSTFDASAGRPTSFASLRGVHSAHKGGDGTHLSRCSGSPRGSGSSRSSTSRAFSATGATRSSWETETSLCAGTS